MSVDYPSNLQCKTITVPCVITMRPASVVEADRKIGLARDKFLKMPHNKRESYLNKLADIKLRREINRLAGIEL